MSTSDVPAAVLDGTFRLPRVPRIRRPVAGTRLPPLRRPPLDTLVMDTYWIDLADGPDCDEVSP